MQYARSADAVTKRAVAVGAARFAFRHHDSRPRQRNRGGHQRSDCSWIAPRVNEIEATQRLALNATSIGGRQHYKNKLLDVVQSFRGGRTVQSRMPLVEMLSKSEQRKANPGKHKHRAGDCRGRRQGCDRFQQSHGWIPHDRTLLEGLSSMMARTRVDEQSSKLWRHCYIEGLLARKNQ